MKTFKLTIVAMSGLAIAGCEPAEEAPDVEATEDAGETAVITATYTDGDEVYENEVISEPMDLDNIAKIVLLGLLKDGRALMLDTDTRQVFVACPIPGTTNGFQPCPTVV